MILTIKEAAALLNKLAQYVPDEKVELKFLEGEPVTARPKAPFDLMFAQFLTGEAPTDTREKLRAHMELPGMKDESFRRVIHKPFNELKPAFPYRH